MTVHRKPPPEAVCEKMRLAATWAVVKKRKTDPDNHSFPRLSLRSTDQIQIAYGIDLEQCKFVYEFDVKRNGVWIGLVDAAFASRGRGVCLKFAFWKNQTRMNFYSMAGDFKGMGTEFHDVEVEVWRNFGSEDVIASWLFAPMKHAELAQRFKGSGARPAPLA